MAATIHAQTDPFDCKLFGHHQYMEDHSVTRVAGTIN